MSRKIWDKKWEGALGLIRLGLLVTMEGVIRNRIVSKDVQGKEENSPIVTKGEGRPVEVAEMSHQPE